MPEDDGLPLSSILSNTASSVIRAQQRLDGIGPARDAGVYAIPAVNVAFQFGVAVRDTKRFLFIPKGEKRNRTQHKLSFALIAGPDPPPPPGQEMPGEATGLPFELAEPGFLVDESEEQSVVDRLTTALLLGRWRARMLNPSKLTQKAIDAAANDILESQQSPDESNPQLGVICFRVAESPASWLVVHLTKDSDNDGVFLLPDEDSPIVDVFTVPNDKNDKIVFLPLALVIQVVRRWMGSERPRRILFPTGLPRRWGISALDSFARSLFEGYLNCMQLLSAQPAEGALPTCYNLNRVAAEIGVSISYAKGTPQFRVVSDTEDEYLIQSRVGVAIERVGPSARLLLELVAPGFVLGATERDSLARQIAERVDDVADAFTLDPEPRADYVQSIRSPADANGIVVFVSAEKAGATFRFLVVWPGRLSEQARDFVFSCRQSDRKIDDFHAVIRMEDDMATTAIDAPESAEGGLSEDQYQQFSRFFRAVRLWRAGIGG